MTTLAKFFDTIIVGAGVAGLNAGRLLHQAGYRVLIIEARERVGGRILMLHKSGLEDPIELGAEFVHGVPRELRELVVPEVDFLEIEGEYLITGPQGPQADYSYFEKLQSVLDQLPSDNGEDLSFSEFLSRHASGVSAEIRTMAKSYVEGYHAADAQKISAHVLGGIEREGKEVGATERAVFFNHGWKAFVDRLAEPVRHDIQLNCPVKRITWQAGKAVVDCEFSGGLTRSYCTQSVLITLPVGVLKQPPNQVGGIQFQPELPLSKSEALSKMEMSEAIRITYRFKEPIWEKVEGLQKWALLLDVTPGSKLRTWWARGRLLTGWLGGPEVRLWTDLSEKARLQYGVSTIARLFGISPDVVERALETSYFHDWSADPYSRGVYNYVLVGGRSAQKHLAQPCDGTLFFAGEATHSGGFSGTVNGALISGARAAQEITRVLQK